MVSQLRTGANLVVSQVQEIGTWYHNPQEKSEELEPLQSAEKGDI